MTVSESLAVVRGILYATSRSKHDQLSTNRARRVNELKRRRNGRSDISVDEADDQPSTFVYAVRGQKVCRSTFANLLWLKEQTIARQAKKTATASCFQHYDTRLSESQRGHLGPQKQIINGLLNNLASIGRLKCPTGQASTNENMVLLLPSEMNRSGLYQDYFDVYDKREDAARDFISCFVPTALPSGSAYSKYLDRGHPALKSARSRSGFCELLHEATSRSSIHGQQRRRAQFLSNLLLQHRENAPPHHNHWRHQLTSFCGIFDGTDQHAVSDFVEKLLLLRLL